MRSLLLILLLSVSTLAIARPSSKIRTQIADDGAKLSIRIDGIKDGEEIYYQHTFDITGMNGFQKDLLKYQAFHSAGVSLPLHEMQWLISGIIGFISLILVIVGISVRYTKTVAVTRANSLHSS